MLRMLVYVEIEIELQIDLQIDLHRAKRLEELNQN